MPNHTENKLYIKSDKMEEIAQLVFAEELDHNGDKVIFFDFNSLVPTPDNIFQGDLGPEEEALYGVNTWFYWNRANWGTKWNSYNTKFEYGEKGGMISFQTAWNPPFPVIEKLAARFPDAQIEHKYLDEGWRYWGVDVYNDGQKERSGFVDGQFGDTDTDSFVDLFIELKGYHPHEDDD